jgi:hypothetical protein
LQEIREESGLKPTDFAMALNWTYIKFYRRSRGYGRWFRDDVDDIVRSGMIKEGGWYHRELLANLGEKPTPLSVKEPEPTLVVELLGAVTCLVKDDDKETMRQVLKLILERTARRGNR